MKYEITSNGKTITVEIEEVGRFQFRLLIDGKERFVDAHRTEPCVYSILIDGRSYEVDVTQNGEDFAVNVEGETHLMNVVDQKRKALRRIVPHQSSSGIQIIKAPMPGRVIRILKRKGEKVSKNQGLIVVEAMKMENELKANGDGVVKEVFVKEGETVEAGQKLLEVE